MSERQIFEHALELTDPARREQFLCQACGADHELRQRIDALLTSHDEQSRFLETPVVQQIQTPPDSSGEATVQLPPGTYAAHDDDSDVPRSADLSFLKSSTKPGSIGLLGHYEILQVLGQGAFGIVFKAFDEKLQRHVAIKTMNVQMAATSPPRKRFLREARAAAAIRHDNVTQVYSVEEEPIPYLVMEYIDGITLHTKLNSVGPLDIPEMLHLGKQIALGLAAAHEKGLVHRDIKPGNILLEKGAEQKVKITDFGLARAADDASLTQSGLIAGTPLYMAPEQALGQALDARTDLFSFGSVLYQMAAGHPPFRAPTTVAVLRRVVDDTQRPLREIIPEIPDWFAAIVNKLLAKKSDDRYQSAKDVADLLARCQSELQLTGQVTCVPESVRREPAGSATVLTGQSGGSRPPLASGSASQTTPEKPYPRIRSWPVVLSVVLVMGIQLVGLMLKTNRTTTLALSIGAMLLSVLLGVGELFSFRKRQREFREGSASALPEKKLTANKVIFALLLGLLMMSPILFGRHLSRLTSSWFFGSIPTLPAVERAAGLRFDGEDDFVQVPVSWDHPQFTIEAFVTPEEAGPHRTVVELTNYGSGTKDERLELYDAVGGKGERLSFAAVTGRSGRFNAYGPQTPGIREHRAIVCDGQEIHYYINGIWQGKRNNQPQDNQLWRMRWLTIGCQLGETNFFKGEIDQLRISKVARYTDNFPTVSLVESDDATLALYNFEEGTGDLLKDMSGNGHDAKISGATWIHPAQGLQFDGVDDYVEFTGLTWNSNQYTIEAYISQDGGHGNLFQTAGTGGMLHMYLYPQGGGAGINRDQVYANANGPRKGKTRQHLAVVYDGQNLNYFVQGQLAGVKTNVSAAATPMSLDRMMIGSKLQTDPSKPEFFAGRLEQLRVSDNVRYVLPFTPGELKTDDQTLALYDFTTEQGDVVKDVSGRSPDGKIVGATWVNRSSPAGSGQWIDALSLIDPGSDKFDLPGMTGRNEWKREGDHLVVGPDKLASKLVLPLDSPWSAFECDLEFIRRSGTGGLNLNIPTRTGECSMVVDHASGNGGVFLGARGKGVVLSEGKKIETGKRTTLNVTVRRLQNQDQITVSLNGKAAGQWTGNRNDIGKESTERFPVSRRISLWIHEGNNEFEFQRIRLRPLDGETVTATRPQTGWHGWPADAPPPAIASFDTEQAKQHQAAWAKHLGIPAEFTDKYGTQYVLIPPGEFRMGFSQAELDTLTRELKQAGAGEYDLFSASTSGPQHTVRITKPLYMSAHEVTVAEYRKFIDETHYMTTAEQLGGQRKKWTEYLAPENPDPHPVLGVSWTDAETYCVLRSQQDGVTYRLPTEAEWEYACRAGTTTLWSFGDNPAQIGEYAVTAPAGTSTQPVGSRKPNPLGLFDMYGNAEEWCLDWHTQDFYANCPTDDPVNLKTPTDANSGRVARGGGTVSLPWQLRSSTRRWDFPSTPVNLKGFRVVITGDLKKAATNLAVTGWHGWPADAPPPAIAPFNAEQARQHQEAWAKYLNVPVEYTNSIGMKFRLIPPGEFLMGSTPMEIEASVQFSGNAPDYIEAARSEGPLRKVAITKPFYMGATEVTQRNYERIVSMNPSHFSPSGPGRQEMKDTDTADHPVDSVDWNNASRFCDLLSSKDVLRPEPVNPNADTAQRYQLPTEAEWEFACRAGTETSYWCGDLGMKIDAVAWTSANSEARTHRVAQKLSNPFGLYDVYGNAFEWTADSWTRSIDVTGKSNVDPFFRTTEEKDKVLRGGCCFETWALCRSGRRFQLSSELTNTFIGFRVSLPVDAVRQALKGTGPAMPNDPNATASKFPPLAPGWFERVSKLPPEEQVKEVSLELKRRNPEWDEKLEHEVRDDYVRGMKFDSAHVADITPMSVLTRLHFLHCPASNQLGLITDLSPLAGMKNLGNVKFVFCTELVDLSPLRDSPISYVDLEWTSVADLSPLAGKPIGFLHLVGCMKVTDVSPLSGAPLDLGLHISSSAIRDLTPFAASKVAIATLDESQFDPDIVCRWPLKRIAGLDKVPREKLVRLKEIKTLETINGKPVAEFWKEFDAAAPMAPTLSELFTSPGFEWSAPLNLGANVNSPGREANPTLTADELLIVFSRDGIPFEARRGSREEPFGPATKLVGSFVSSGNPSSVSISGDGLQLVFSSGAIGEEQQDIMLATRQTRDEPFGEPVRLPQPINSPGEDRHPVLSPDGLMLSLTSDRKEQKSGAALIFTRTSPDAEFNATPTVDPNLQLGWDVITSFSADGRGLLKTTMVDGQEVNTWHIRTGDANTWSAGQPLPAPFDAIKFGASLLSADGNTVYFHSRSLPDGQGELDLWMSRRKRKD